MKKIFFPFICILLYSSFAFSLGVMDIWQKRIDILREQDIKTKIFDIPKHIILKDKKGIPLLFEGYCDFPYLKKLKSAITFSKKISKKTKDKRTAFLNSFVNQDVRVLNEHSAGISVQAFAEVCIEKGINKVILAGSPGGFLRLKKKFLDVMANVLLGNGIDVIYVSGGIAYPYLCNYYREELDKTGVIYISSGIENIEYLKIEFFLNNLIAVKFEDLRYDIERFIQEGKYLVLDGLSNDFKKENAVLINNKLKTEYPKYILKKLLEMEIIPCKIVFSALLKKIEYLKKHDLFSVREYKIKKLFDLKGQKIERSKYFLFFKKKIIAFKRKYDKDSAYLYLYNFTKLVMPELRDDEISIYILSDLLNHYLKRKHCSFFMNLNYSDDISFWKKFSSLIIKNKVYVYNEYQKVFNNGDDIKFNNKNMYKIIESNADTTQKNGVLFSSDARSFRIIDNKKKIYTADMAAAYFINVLSKQPYDFVNKRLYPNKDINNKNFSFYLSKSYDSSGFLDHFVDRVNSKSKRDYHIYSTINKVDDKDIMRIGRDSVSFYNNYFIEDANLAVLMYLFGYEDKAHRQITKQRNKEFLKVEDNIMLYEETSLKLIQDFMETVDANKYVLIGRLNQISPNLSVVYIFRNGYRFTYKNQVYITVFFDKFHKQVKIITEGWGKSAYSKEHLYHYSQFAAETLGIQYEGFTESFRKIASIVLSFSGIKDKKAAIAEINNIYFNIEACSDKRLRNIKNKRKFLEHKFLTEFVNIIKRQQGFDDVHEYFKYIKKFNKNKCSRFDNVISNVFKKELSYFLVYYFDKAIKKKSRQIFAMIEFAKLLKISKPIRNTIIKSFLDETHDDILFDRAIALNNYLKEIPIINYDAKNFLFYINNEVNAVIKKRFIDIIIDEIYNGNIDKAYKYFKKLVVLFENYDVFEGIFKNRIISKTRKIYYKIIRDYEIVDSFIKNMKKLIIKTREDNIEKMYKKILNIFLDANGREIEEIILEKVKDFFIAENFDQDLVPGLNQQAMLIKLLKLEDAIHNILIEKYNDLEKKYDKQVQYVGNMKKLYMEFVTRKIKKDPYLIESINVWLKILDKFLKVTVICEEKRKQKIQNKRINKILKKKEKKEDEDYFYYQNILKLLSGLDKADKVSGKLKIAIGMLEYFNRAYTDYDYMYKGFLNTMLRYGYELYEDFDKSIVEMKEIKEALAKEDRIRFTFLLDIMKNALETASIKYKLKAIDSISHKINKIVQGV